MAARDVTSWLPNLLGPIDLQVNGEDVSVPKREIINIVGVGVEVEDNPGNNSTDITLPAAASLTEAVLRATSATLTAALPVNTQQITGLAAGSAASHAVNKSQMDAADAATLASANAYTDAATPTFGSPVAVGTANADGSGAAVARANHVHDLTFATLNTVLGEANATLGVNSQKIGSLADGTVSSDAINKGQLDAAISALSDGIRWKSPVKALASSNITLSGAQTIDGVSIVAGDRVAAIGQTTASARGIYVAAAGAWTRASDLAAGSSAASIVFAVEQGTAAGDRRYYCTNDTGSAVVGTDGLAFIEIPSIDLATVAPSNVGTSAVIGTSPRAAKEDHVHDLTFTTLNSVIAEADAPVSFGSQTVSGGTPTTSSHFVTKAYADGLQPNALAYRQELTLVAGYASVAGTTFSRVAERFIDLTPFPATIGALNRTVKFIACIERVTVGSAEIRLWNRTESEAVTGTTLSSSSETSVQVSATLTVGASAGNLKDDFSYEVQLRSTDGGGTGICTNARLEITYA